MSIKKKEHNAYKDLYDESCDYICQMVEMFRIDTKKVPGDAWTLGTAIRNMLDENKKYKDALNEIGWVIPKKDAPDGRMEYNAFKASKMGYTARKALGYDGVLFPNEKDIDEPPF